MSEYFGQCFLYQFADVDRIDILVVDDVQQTVEFVARGIDDVEPTAGEMAGVETAHQYAQNHAQSHEDGCEAVYA